MGSKWPEALLFVFTNCTDPQREDEFNKWYDSIHIPDLLELPGVTGAERYRNLRPGEGGQFLPKYLAIYEIDSKEPLQVVRHMLATMPDRQKAGRMIDCIEIKLASTFERVR